MEYSMFMLFLEAKLKSEDLFPRAFSSWNFTLVVNSTLTYLIIIHLEA